MTRPGPGGRMPWPSAPTARRSSSATQRMIPVEPAGRRCSTGPARRSHGSTSGSRKVRGVSSVAFHPDGRTVALGLFELLVIDDLEDEDPPVLLESQQR